MPEIVRNSTESGGFIRPMGEETKTAVSITQMAQMCNLSRQRFHQLIGTVFPCPLYNVRTRRPFYPEDLQLICLECRRKNLGVNGQVVLFYSSRLPTKPVAKRPRVQNPNTVLLENLRSLGLVVTWTQVEAAIKTLFPKGIENIDQGEVIRSIFIHFKAKGV